MTESIFNEPQEQQTPSPEIAALNALVGEGKKFKTVEDLAKGKQAADEHIARLERELADLRTDSTTRARLEEIVDRLTSQERTQENNYEGDNRNLSESPSQPQLNQDALERLIDQKLTRREQRQTATQNQQAVIAQLQQVFGTDYLSKLEARRTELGLERSDMDALAARSPTAFMALVSPTQAGTGHTTAPRSSVRSEALPTQTVTAQPGTWAYYEALKKSDPKKYWTPEIQGKLHKDAIKASREGRDF